MKHIPVKAPRLHQAPRLAKFAYHTSPCRRYQPPVRPGSAIMGRAVYGGVFAAVAAALAASLGLLEQPIIPWERELMYKFERNTTRLPQQEDINESDYTRVTILVPSHGDMLEAWLYEPVAQDPATPPPIVIMSHGLGSQKDMGLHAYAEQFSQAGMAVMVFDYRGFGGSDGAVRHWVSWRRQIEDIQSVLDFVAAGKLGPTRVDTKRIALWGVSYSGGHMITVASKQQNWDKVKALVANEPYLNGDGNLPKALKERGTTVVLRLLFISIVDKVRELLGMGPIYVKLIAPFGEMAVLNVSPEELAASRSAQMSPPVRIGGWKNAIAARMLIDNFLYKPIHHVEKIRCPTLFVAGTKDDLTPASLIRKAAKTLGDKAQILERPYGHIEMHRKMVAPEEMAPVIDFLRHQLDLHPDHVPTKPHEEHPEKDASEVL